MSADIEQNHSPRSLNATHGHPSFGTPHLPQAALCHLASASKRLRSVSDWNLNLAELPPGVQAKLADFDSDGALQAEHSPLPPTHALAQATAW